MTYRIEVTVSGGFTGYGQSVLKENGVIWETDDRAAADEKAREYNESMNGPYSTASFRAKVVELY